MRHARLALFTSAMAVAALQAAADEAWRPYANTRFGATADVPMDWQAGVPPTNGDGLEFRSPDGEATLIVSGALHVDATIGEAMDRFAKPDEGEVVTSTERDERSVTVAGDAGDHAFYRRSILSCHDQVWDTISIEYPASKEAQYAPLIAHIAASLRSGPSAEVPDCP